MKKNAFTPTLALIVVLLVTDATLMVVGPQAWASHYHNFPAGSELINDNFGYATTFTNDIHGVAAVSVDSDIDHSQKQLDGITPNALIDGNSAPAPITATGFVNIMTTAMNDWENSVGVNTDMPRWTMVRDDNSSPSLFGDICLEDGERQNNGVYEIGFCDSFGIAFVDVWPNIEARAANGGIDFITESDMMFNSEIVWSNAFLEQVATHELGHFLGLGDMYNIYGGSADDCDAEEVLYGATGPPAVGPVMCSGDRVDVARGDINGIYYLYPHLETVTVTSTQDDEEETDMAIAELSGSADNTEPEFVVLQINEDITPTPDEQHFVVRPFLDVDENTYEETNGSQVDLFTIPIADINEVGLSLVNIAQGTEPEMIISWIESTNIGYWRVYWDVDLVSGNLAWDGISNIQTMPSLLASTGGIDTVFMNMDGDAALEMVVIKSRLDGSNQVVYYSYVQLDGTTGAASGAWTHVNNPTPTIQIEDDKLGAGIINDGDRLVAIANQIQTTFTQEYMGYRVVRLNTDGTVDEVSIRSIMPLEPISGTTDVDGFGADAYNWQSVGVTGAQYKDLVTMWMEGGATNFVVDRDSKYNAHGDSDNAVPGGVLIDAEDCSGNVLSGMAVYLYDSGGVLLQSGFTPMYRDITTTGTYMVKYNNFGGYTYVTAETQPTPVTASRQFTSWGGEADLSLSASVPYRVVGVYTSSGTTCPAGGGSGSITIRAEREDTGVEISGLYVQLQNSGHTEIDNGFTTVTFPSLAADTYYVYPNDFSPYFFSHWEDTGSTTRERQVVLGSGQTPTYTAVYDYVP